MLRSVGVDYDKVAAETKSMTDAEIHQILCTWSILSLPCSRSQVERFLYSFFAYGNTKILTVSKAFFTLYFVLCEPFLWTIFN